MTTTTGVRERTYAWNDPAELAAAAARTDGLDLLNRIGAGELPIPPAAATTGIRPVEVGDGFAVFDLDPAEWQYNPMGTVHGGILSTLADTALGCAVHTTLSAGTGYTTLDLTMKFTRAVTVDSGTVRCEAHVVSRGRRTATAEARVTDAAGRVVAHGVTTCILLA
ncbi:PaaI family thioesterase [Microbacterium sp. GXF7504]